jgi:hypothetical protein
VLEINGEYETPELSFRPRQPQAAVVRNSRTGTNPVPSLARRGGIAHWDVPPAFDHAKDALSSMGVEAYKEAVRAYYAAVGANGVAYAQRSHARWVVRQLLHKFETHVRGFRRQSVSKRGGVFHTAGELALPDELWKDGRLMVDLPYLVRRYQVHEELHELTVRLVRQKLRTLWGLR